MNRNCFWLTKEQFARLRSLLPTDTRGKPRVDDRRVISGTRTRAEVGRSLG
jgi:transposase